jgi:hypothetical protein
MWQIIKNSAGDFWDELLYLVIFNILWMIGVFLIIPYPFVTFGLFFVAHEVSEGKGIKLGTFFSQAGRVWKQAYLWGIINLVVMVIIWSNINFYGQINAGWASIVQMFTIALFIAWLVLQLFTLAFYPRLTEPRFKPATRNAMVAIARYPGSAVLLVLVIVLLVIATTFVQAIVFLGVFALVAVVATRLVKAIIEQEKARETDKLAE